MKIWNILIVLVFVLGPPAAKWISQLLARNAEKRKHRQLEEARLTGRGSLATSQSRTDTSMPREGGAASAETRRKAEIAARRQVELERWRAARVESGLPVSDGQGSRVRVGTAGSPPVDVERRRREALEELRRRRTSSLLQQRQDALGQGLSPQTGAPSPAFSQSTRRVPTSAPTGRRPVAASRGQPQQPVAGVSAPSPRRHAPQEQQWQRQQQRQRQQQQREPGSVRRLVATSRDLTTEILQHEREHDVVTSAELGMALDPLHPNRWSIKALRRAIIMKEILGPPVALRVDWTLR